MAAASQLRISAARNTAENATKEEALLQRFVQLKSELEEHQELSKQQEDKQKVLLDKLNETHQQRPKTRIDKVTRHSSRCKLRIAASLKASLDAAKEAAAAEAMKANQMEQDLEMQRKELEHLAEEAARQDSRPGEFWETPAFMGILDLIFAFSYLGEVLVKLSVKSWSEYCSFWGNQFDFFTTWLLLFTTLLPYLPFAMVQAESGRRVIVCACKAGALGCVEGGRPEDLKRYANILRLFRLVRIVKQLKQLPRVQFMVATISRMDTEYGKKHLYIFNFNDMSMAFITFFAQLLSEYVPENATALQAASSWGNVAWYIFPQLATGVMGCMCGICAGSLLQLLRQDLDDCVVKKT
eukprot:g11500.t1